MNLKLRLRGPSARPRRSTNRPYYYEDSATDTETDDSPSPPTSPVPWALRSRPTNIPLTSTRALPSPPRRKLADTADHDLIAVNAPPKKKRRTLTLTSPKKAFKGKEKVVDAEDMLENTGVSPPWETLPYEILVNIFKSASQPFYDKFFRANSSIHWLLDMATVCKAFCEPALAALYHSPPLMPQVRSHKLLQFLSTSQDSTAVNYTNKIHRLELEVYNGLITKGGAHGYFDLAELIKKTPQLRELHLYNWNDRVMNEPGQTRSRIGRWGYPQPIFDALDETKIRLRSFEWNGSFSEARYLAEEMSKVHQRPAFQSLQDLTFVDFYLTRQNTPSYQNLEESLASSLAHLPGLRRLKFQNCSLVNEQLLPNLRLGLESITFDNCENLSSLNLRPFLASHGSQLKELRLDHNSSLNISFLTELASSCPVLEVLTMDLHYFSTHVITNDSEPRFNQLLLTSEIPTWPSTLQILEFNQLRKWEPQAAEMFFGSLLDSALDLKALRQLVIKAIVNIGWRDRASFRETWIGRLERVFLRHSSPPDDKMNSLAAYREFHESLKKAIEGKAKERSTKRRSTRIAHREDEEIKSSSFSPKHARNGSPSNSNSLKSVSGSQDFSLKGTRSHSPEAPDTQSAQGMCHTLTIRIDNLRPAESQMTEADFLDSEASGDEDWDGKDPKGKPGYAW